MKTDVRVYNYEELVPSQIPSLPLDLRAGQNLNSNNTSYGGVSWSNNGLYLAISDDANFRIYKRESLSSSTLTLIGTPTGLPPYDQAFPLIDGIVWSPDDKYIACGGTQAYGGTIIKRVGDTFTYVGLLDIYAEDDLLEEDQTSFSPIFSPDGRYLVFPYSFKNYTLTTVPSPDGSNQLKDSATVFINNNDDTFTRLPFGSIPAHLKRLNFTFSSFSPDGEYYFINSGYGAGGADLKIRTDYDDGAGGQFFDPNIDIPNITPGAFDINQPGYFYKVDRVNDNFIPLVWNYTIDIVDDTKNTRVGNTGFGPGAAQISWHPSNRYVVFTTVDQYRGFGSDREFAFDLLLTVYRRNDGQTWEDAIFGPTPNIVNTKVQLPIDWLCNYSQYEGTYSIYSTQSTWSADGKMWYLACTLFSDFFGGGSNLTYAFDVDTEKFEIVQGGQFLCWQQNNNGFIDSYDVNLSNKFQGIVQPTAIYPSTVNPNPYTGISNVLVDDEAGITLEATPYQFPNGEPRTGRRFQLKRLDEPSWINSVIDTTVNQDTLLVSVDLQPDTFYQWRCRDFSANYSSAWMNAQTFFNNFNVISSTTQGSDGIVIPPKIIVQGAPDNIQSGPYIRTAPYKVYGENTGPHISTSWNIKRLDAIGGNVVETVFSSLADTENLTEIYIPRGTLLPNTPYRFEVKHNSDAFNPSFIFSELEYTTPTEFESTEQLVLVENNPFDSFKICSFDDARVKNRYDFLEPKPYTFVEISQFPRVALSPTGENLAMQYIKSGGPNLNPFSNNNVLELYTKDVDGNFTLQGPIGLTTAEPTTDKTTTLKFSSDGDFIFVGRRNFTYTVGGSNTPSFNLYERNPLDNTFSAVSETVTPVAVSKFASGGAPTGSYTFPFIGEVSYSDNGDYIAVPMMVDGTQTTFNTIVLNSYPYDPNNVLGGAVSIDRPLIEPNPVSPPSRSFVKAAVAILKKVGGTYVALPETVFDDPIYYPGVSIFNSDYQNSIVSSFSANSEFLAVSGFTQTFDEYDAFRIFRAIDYYENGLTSSEQTADPQPQSIFTLSNTEGFVVYQRTGDNFNKITVSSSILPLRRITDLKFSPVTADGEYLAAAIDRDGGVRFIQDDGSGFQTDFQREYLGAIYKRVGNTFNQIAILPRPQFQLRVNNAFASYKCKWTADGKYLIFQTPESVDWGDWLFAFRRDGDTFTFINANNRGEYFFRPADFDIYPQAIPGA